MPHDATTMRVAEDIKFRDPDISRDNNKVSSVLRELVED